MTFPGADTSRTSDNMAPGSPEKEREREDGRSPDLREPLIQAPHYNKKGSYHSALAVCPKSSAGQQSACCCCEVASVVSDSVRPHRRQATRLPRPWDSPGKNTGVGCHFLLQCLKVKSESEVTQLCPTLSDPMDCSLPGSSIHRIFQARVLEWGAIAFSDWILYFEVSEVFVNQFYIF